MAEQQVNIGKVPQKVAEALDVDYHRICLLLRKHGHEIIPKKMLRAAFLHFYLNPFLNYDTKEAEEAAINELVGNIEKFWKEHGGSV